MQVMPACSDTSYQHVPWYSMHEWKLVYDQIYSSNIDDIKKAYRRLLVWKARVEDLPAGVECTLGILQIRLREKELSQLDQSIIGQEDLQLMYSTAIIRFLNLISELEQGRGSTLYYKAQGMDIPSWIVNLRHDAAHSHVLPALSLLKAGAEFVFNWLNDYYWKNEAAHTFDYYIKLPTTKPIAYTRNVRRILALVKIYVEIALDSSDNISEETLTSLSSLDVEVDPDDTQDKVKILDKILHGLNKKISKERRKHNILSGLVEDSNLLTEVFPGKSRMELKSAWCPIFTILNKNQILIDLVRILLDIVQENETRSEPAALWIEDIAQGFIKLDRCLNVKLDLEKKNPNLKLSPKQMFKLTVSVTNKTYTKLQSAILLKGKMPQMSALKEILEQATRNPCRHTLLFLDSLCFLNHIPKAPVVQLVKIFINNQEFHCNGSTLPPVFTLDNIPHALSIKNNKSQVSRIADQKTIRNADVFTLDEILQKYEWDADVVMQEMEVEDENMELNEERIEEDVENGEENIWTLAKDLDWLHCPLGAIPGKQHMDYIDFDVLQDKTNV